jgi:hypothetical protein
MTRGDANDAESDVEIDSTDHDTRFSFIHLAP